MYRLTFIKISSPYEQNFTDKISFENFQTKFVLLFKTGPRDDTITQWIVELGREVRNLIPHADRVNIDWQACKVKPYTILTRCYKCHRYGHTAKTFSQEKPTCGHCAKEGQSLKECPEKNWNYKCANCISDKSKTVNHDVASNKCPLYNHEMKRAQKLISYDE